MKTRMIYLICLVLFLVGPVQAENITWTGAINSDWLNPDNWDLGRIPALDDTPRIGSMPGPVIDAPGAVCERLDHGRNAEADLTVLEGGVLEVTGGNNDINLGRGGAKGILNVVGGTVTVSRDLDMGDQGVGAEGVVNMFGGTLNIGDDLELPNIHNALGTFTMTGGTVNLTDELDMAGFVGETKMQLYGGTFNIATGGDLMLNDPGEFDLGGCTFVMGGNFVDTIQGFIDNGYIIAYDANGTVLPVDYDADKDITTLKALHKFNPIPADRSIASPGTTTLEWTVDAGTLVDVWVSTSLWDNTWEQIVDKQAVTSVTVTTERKQRYYWAVDTYVAGVEDPILGHVFGFVADNAPPVVNAGANATTWIDNGSVEAALSGMVDDNDPTTTTWSVIAYDSNEPSDPNELLPVDGPVPAVIADPTQLETTVAIGAVGTYELQLIADDGEYQGEDTMIIYVFADSCLAAQSLPGFEFNVADINQDCFVDELDRAIMLDNWLKDSCILCPDPNNP
ncbi:hypothetical protein ACFL6U_08730 [Planctomycetota bacterium]